MLDQTGKQRIADVFNRAISQEKFDHKRLGAIYALKRFEAAAWYPQALQQAIEELAHIILTYKDGSPSPDLTDIVDIKADTSDICEVLQRYIEIVEEKTGAPAIENELFSGRSAAWYIARRLQLKGQNVTVRAVDLHLRGTEELKPYLEVGRAGLYTRQQLDEYADNFKAGKRGRPAKVEPSNP
jgi:hypothetical protein